MSISKKPGAKADPQPSQRRVATLDDLRKPRRIQRVMAFCLQDIPEPQRPNERAIASERDDYRKAKERWEKEVEAATVEVVIRSLPRRDYDALVNSHPAGEEAVERAQRQGQDRPRYDADKFAPALLAVSIAEPEGITEEDAQGIWDEWPQGDAINLVEACVAINQFPRIEFYQKKSGKTDG